MGEYGIPQTRLLFFQDANGSAPVWEWLRDLRTRNPKAYAKCAVRIRRLVELGRELRRPEADLLRDGIYELRARDLERSITGFFISFMAGTSPCCRTR